MNKVFARIHPKALVERFFRCGIQFTKEWPKDPITVDAATEKRLKEEQMLEVVPEPSFAEYLVALAAQISERAGVSGAPAADAAAPGADASGTATSGTKRNGRK